MLITEFQSGGLHFVLDKDNAGRARLIHFSTKPFDRENYKMENYSSFHSLLELHMLGYDTNDHHCMNYRFYDNASVVRSFAEVINVSEEEQTIDYISSFKFAGLALENERWDKETYISIPHSGCHGELQWRRNSIYQMGLTKYNLGCTKKLSWS